jgi:hypothetical protein
MKTRMKQDKSYLQRKITEILPALMDTVQQDENGTFIFTHEKFPELRVEGVTFSFVEEHVERALRRQFRTQSDKHIDILFNLLSK